MKITTVTQTFAHLIPTHDILTKTPNRINITLEMINQTDFQQKNGKFSKCFSNNDENRVSFNKKNLQIIIF